MDFQFRRFQDSDFPEYESWFKDQELDRQLGPMDQEWLQAVLSEPESQGTTWAISAGGGLVAVLETKHATLQHPYEAITAVAVKPALRRKGIGRAVLEKYIAGCRAEGARTIVAYVSESNPAAREFVFQQGFVQVIETADESGYIEYRLKPDTCPEEP